MEALVFFSIVAAFITGFILGKKTVRKPKPVNGGGGSVMPGDKPKDQEDAHQTT